MRIDLPKIDGYDIEIHASVSITSFPQTMARARELLDIAQKLPEHSNTLAAAATIFLVTALEQSIDSSLEIEITQSRSQLASGKVNPQHVAKLDDFNNSTLRNRMAHLPNVLTRGKSDLNPNDPHLKLLHKMISIRNKLTHISEEAHVVPIENVKDEQHFEEPTTQCEVALGDRTFPVQIPDSWFRPAGSDVLTIELVEGFYEATELYERAIYNIFVESSNEIHIVNREDQANQP
jgi:hypothetical protein